MGDVQGKHGEDSDAKAITPVDPRDLLGPPSRVAMERSQLPSYHVSPATPPVGVTADFDESSKRRKSYAGSSVVSSVTAVLEQDAKEGSGRHNKNPGLSVFKASSSSSQSVNSQARRKSYVTQPLTGQVPEKSRKQSTIFRPPSLQSKSKHVENQTLPLAEAITKRTNLSDKEPLVFEEPVRIGGTERTVVGSYSNRSSPDCVSSAKMTMTSQRSGSSVSEGDALVVPGRWRQRWCIDEVGRDPGQIRCIKDLCMLRSGSIVATEPKNTRLQIFAKNGKSLAVLGPDSDDLRSARSFGNPLALRKMQPTGVAETVVDNLVAVTDLNRVLYVEATPDGVLHGEVILKGKTDLRGIATTWSSKIIVTEVGSQASVGLYETSGKFIREYKGNFRKPCYVTYDPTYDVAAVSDGEQGLVFLYDVSGNLLTKFGAPRNGTGNRLSAGHLVYPSGLSWSSHGRLVVADEVQKKVVVFDLRNLTAETLLSADDGLNRPVAVATDFRDSRNRIYAAEEVYDFEVNKFCLKMFEQRSTAY